VGHEKIPHRLAPMRDSLFFAYIAGFFAVGGSNPFNRR
jgi:hypothetical protein